MMVDSMRFSFKKFLYGMAVILFSNTLAAAPTNPTNKHKHEAPAAKSPPIEDRIDDELMKVGWSVIPRPEALEYHQIIEALLKRLTPVAERILREEYGRKSPLVVDFTLRKSLRPNAFVGEVRGYDNKRKVKLAITSGLMDLFFDQAKTDEDFELALRRTAGVLAHELAHLIDFYDPHGIEARGQGARASQAIELRTDSEALNFLREAKLPMRSMYDTLTVLGNWEYLLTSSMGVESEFMSAINAVASTHPEIAMRRTAVAGVVTLYPRRRGDPEVLPVELPPALRSGIEMWQAAIQAERQASKALPADLGQFLEGLAAGKWRPTHSNAELFIELVQRLETQGPHLTARETKDLQEFLLDSLRLSEDSIFEHWNIRSGLEPSIWKRWRACIEDLRSIFTPEFRQAADAILRKTEDFSDHVMFGDIAWGLLPEKMGLAYVEQIAIEITAEINKQAHALQPTRTAISRLQAAINLVLGSSPVNDAISLKIQAEILSKLNLRNKVIFLSQGARLGGIDQVVWAFQDERAAEEFPTPGRFEIKPYESERETVLKTIAQAIWNERELYTAIDFIDSQGRQIDWGAIFQRLAIPSKEGTKELNAAFKRFASSERMQELLDLIHRLPQPTVARHEAVPWADDSLGPYVRGAKSPGLSRVEITLAKRIFGRTYHQRVYEGESKDFRKIFAKKLPEDPSEWATSEGHLWRGGPDPTVEKIIEKQTGGLEGVVRHTREIIAEIDKKYAPSSSKTDLLRALLINAESHAVDEVWFTNYRQEEVPGIVDLLLRNHVAGSIIDFIEKLKTREDHSRLIAALEFFWEPIIQEVRLVRSKNELDRLAKLLLDPLDGKYDARYRNGESLKTRFALRRLRGIRDSLAAQYLLLVQSPAHAGDFLTSYFLVTSNGSTATTDRFFRAAFMESGLAKTEPALFARVAGASLESGRIWNPDFQVELGKHVIAAEFVNLGDLRTLEDFDLLAQRIQKLVPSVSLHRDAWTDELAWKTKARDPKVFEPLERLKTTHWRSGTAGLVNQSSGVANLLNHLSPPERFDVIEMLIQGDKAAVPESLIKATNRTAEAEFGTVPQLIQKQLASWEKVELKRDMASGMQVALLEFAHHTRSIEKIPAYELLLTAGQEEPLIESSTWIQRVVLEHVGATGRKAQALTAYLRSVPDLERGFTLAYLISQRGAGGSIVPLFEVFQTVGIKAGQLASLWKLFGEDASIELKKTKDNAKPMTKPEVLEVLKNSLSPEEYARIKDVGEVLGSASIKTVVELKLMDGRVVVALIRSPNAEHQVRTNLHRARAFVRELLKEKLLSENDPILHLLDQAENQLMVELDFIREAEKITAMRKAYADTMNRWGGSREGWTIEAPGLVGGFVPKENLLIVEKADGVNYNRVNPIPEADRVIVDSTLDHLYHGNQFNPDPHRGNFNVDEAVKKLYAYDFGQAIAIEHSTDPLDRTDAYRFSQFLRAVASRDANKIVNATLALSHFKATEDNRARLVEGVTHLLGRPKSEKGQDLFMGIIHLFTEERLPLDPKYSIGVFKGCSTLLLDEYVSKSTLEEILRTHVKAELKRRAQLTIIDEKTTRYGDGPLPSERFNDILRSLQAELESH